MYITADEVYATAGISSSEVATATVNQLILRAEATVDKVTNTTYWKQEDSGTATAAKDTRKSVKYFTIHLLARTHG